MSNPGPNDWRSSPQGRYLLAWEQGRVDDMVADVFGFNAVQLGELDIDLLAANRMPLRVRCGVPELASVCCDARQLPFATASLDLVVLPHVLEFAESPHQILREVERVLVPEGQVVIVGFNPYSLWGVRRWFASSYAGFPWRGKYIGVRRLKDWLALLGFEPQGGRFGCYVPACITEKWLQRWRFLEFMGDRWWPIAGAVYIVQAVKRVQGMRLIQPVWRDRRARAKALAPVTQKGEPTP